MQPLNQRMIPPAAPPRGQPDTQPAHDPAPSRWSYRLQRWMLTPGIRLTFRAGVPFVVVLALGSAFLSDPARQDALNQFIIDLRASIQERPEFRVGQMAIDGAGASVSEDIREVVPIDFPISSFDLDLHQIREVITGLDPVREATVSIRPGGILHVQVTERVPAVVWRSYDGLALLDETGAHVDTTTSRAGHPDLPLIAGAGADRAVTQALRLMAAAGPLRPRLRGLLRIGERRWDVMLDRGQRIKLPARDPLSALERVIALDQARDLLERDLSVVDMRLGERPTIRMTRNAVRDWWRIRKINGSGQ